jgi:hypothetical protein
MVGGADGPDPAVGTPEPMLGGCGAGLAAVARGAAGDGGLRDACFGGGCGLGEGSGACTVTGGSGRVSGVDWASDVVPGEIPSAISTQNSRQRRDTKTPYQLAGHHRGLANGHCIDGPLVECWERYVRDSMMSIQIRHTHAARESPTCNA